VLTPPTLRQPSVAELLKYNDGVIVVVAVTVMCCVVVARPPPTCDLLLKLAW